MDLPVYDVTGLCRDCGREYPTKSFVLRTGDNPVRGFCPDCGEADDARMQRLARPPQRHGKAKDEGPAPRRTWEPE